MSATTCPYCGSSIVLNEKLSGVLEPNLIIPFKLSKDDAIKGYEKFISNKKLLPDDFKVKNIINKLNGIYVPYWLFDADATGHATLGIKMIEEMKKECGCVEERALFLEHMLASHHGQLEFSAIVTPAIPEATMLHALDMIDSRIYVFNSKYENMDEGELSGNVYALDNNSIYKAYNLDIVDC